MKMIDLRCGIDRKGFLIKTQLCKLRVILRSRGLPGGYALVKDTVGDSPANARVDRTETCSLVLRTETV